VNLYSAYRFKKPLMRTNVFAHLCFLLFESTAVQFAELETYITLIK